MARWLRWETEKSTGVAPFPWFFNLIKAHLSFLHPVPPVGGLAFAARCGSNDRATSIADEPIILGPDDRNLVPQHFLHRFEMINISFTGQ